MATGDRCLAVSATVRASEAAAALAFLPFPSFCFLPRLRTAGVPAPTFRLACGTCFPATFAVLIFARSVCSVAIAPTKAPLRRRMVPALPQMVCLGKLWASRYRTATVRSGRLSRGAGTRLREPLLYRRLLPCVAIAVYVSLYRDPHFRYKRPAGGKRHIRRQVVFSSQPIQRTRCRSAPTTELRPAQRICHDAQTPLRA